MTHERKAGWILGAIAVTEGTWCLVNLLVNGGKFIRYLGFAPGRAGEWQGWLAAAVVAALYIAYAARLPSVRANLVRSSGLKALALVVAVVAGILEEVIFRKWVMDGLLHAGYGALVQVIGTALAFGLAHAIWGIIGRSWRAFLGAMIATGTMGAMLGVVYLLAGRSVLPCIASHFLINVFIEPGLMLAAAKGEMGRGRRQ